jgi:hypothetical protein
MSGKYIFPVAGVLLLASTSFASAGQDHTLFNPTPDDQLRPMTTDRPSKTDSPYSLDAGRFQVESNIYGYVENDDCINGACTKSKQHFIGGSTNLRLGLTDNTDMQFIADLYRDLTVEDKTAGTEESKQGYGDMLVRLKVNIMGNNASDKFSLGFVPYIKLPTNQDNLGNNEVEGGVGLPFNINFDKGWSLGGMTQLNLITEPDLSGYDHAYANSLIVGKSITDKISGYAEFYTYKADQSGAKWANTLDFGTIYTINDKWKVDANIALGVTDAADGVNFFVGTAYRF